MIPQSPGGPPPVLLAPVLLAIETSGATCAAAILKTDGAIAERSLDLDRGHADRVVGLCTALLSAEGLEWGALTHIAVNRGPGSFAGLRAGIAAARGFALSLGVPALGVSTFEAMLEGWNELKHEETNAVLALCDLRRGRLGAQLFVRGSGGGSLRMVGEPFMAAAEQLGATLRAQGFDGDALDLLIWDDPNGIRGSGDDHLDSRLDPAAASLREVGVKARFHAVPPSAAQVARAARGAFEAGHLPPPEPLYLRPADAVPASPPLALQAKSSEAVA